MEGAIKHMTLSFPCRILILGVLFLVVASTEARQPLGVIVAKARSEPLIDRLELLGSLRANETVDITSTVTDTLTAIHFEDGQRVAKGDILAEMTSLEEHAQLEEELSNVAEAQKQYDRELPLVRLGVAAPAQLDLRERELAAAKARLRAIESRLKDRLILAPFAGVVGLRTISVGALIEPGDVITTLDDLSQMKLDFSVPAIHLAALRPGIAVEARSPAFVERIFAGTVSSVGSRIDPVTRSVVVRALLDNGDGTLRPGMLMNVTLLKNPRTSLTVPEEALIPRGSVNSVLLVEQQGEQSTVVTKEVAIGQRRDGRVEIRAGLDPGALVITHGTLKVRPGQQVIIQAIDDGTLPLEELLNKQQLQATP
ncbi:efflux RND transporter periplasmic adaptor subunit [Desulfopila aestuarii]|uniref:Membrane fusion protein, multidrug efflux system n=1 Tax=Desulfopila aestuarii DSM 18488 TaxID=1121416 RepID=A0A1M7YF21_9BACT|nr:efflux RND transporter periplasmic adaptor subunit [Desulfopila aestuarii]SHO51108.1 membrane fusion protein, multidrug efflux system [Desulfopila aestuarii DSM 18488]